MKSLKTMILGILLVIAQSLLAIPVKPGLTKTLTLADGTQVTAVLVGDEHGHYWLGQDGKAYQAIPGLGVYQTVDAAQIQQKAALRRSAANQRRMARMPRKVGSVGSISGDKKGIIILVNFTDKTFTATQSDFYNLANTVNYNSGNYKGSMYDYFYAQSEGQFRLTFDVVGPYTLSHNCAYYGGNDSSGDDLRPGNMVKEAVQLANADVNFANYDWDNDGYVDQVYVVYAGKGEADGGDDDTIWPHEWELSSATGSYITLDGKKIDTYACGGEQNGSTGATAGIGTMCHEFSHCLGYPDFYDTDYSGGQGMFEWDLMDSGSYNGNGYRPAGYTSYERWVAGWKTPTELANTQSITDMKALQDSGSDTYIIYNKGNSNEYYLLENRQKKGWDTDLPGAGLLILHVDYNASAWENNTPNDTPSHQRMTWIPADNEYQYTMYQGTKYYTTDGAANDPFPYGNKKSFGRNTTPAATLYNNNSDGTKYLDSSIEDITQNSDGTISFNFVGISSVATPTFSPAAGTYANAQTVSISCETTGATIYYTIDGSVPTTNSSVYSSPLTISETTTVKAIAVKNDEQSAVATAKYKIGSTTSNPNTTTFKLVTSTDELESGLRYIIACGSKNMAAGAMGSGTYLSNVQVDVNDDVITITDNVAVFVLEEGSNGWTFQNEDTNQYLVSTANKNVSYSSNASEWTLSDGTLGVIMSAGDAVGTMLYNNSSPRFTTYTSTPTESMIQANLYVEDSNSTPVTHDPLIVADETLNFSTTVGTPETKTFEVLSEGLTEDITVTLTTNPSNVFSLGSSTISRTASELGSTGSVTFTPTAAGTYNGTVTLTSAGATPVTVALSATATSASTPSTSNEFALVTSGDDFVEGDYLIVYNNGAMKAAVADNRLQYSDVTPANNKITTDDATIIWHIAPSGDNYYTIYNADAGKYAASTGAKSKAQLIADGTDNKSLWSSTSTGSTFDFTNKQNTTNGVNATLRRNGEYGFACYSTQTGGALSLYKRTAGTTTPTKQNVTMSFSPTSATATVGEDFTEPTLTTDPAGLSVTYGSGNTNIATVDASTGDVTPVAAGTTTITATFAGNDDYNSGSASYTLTVNAAADPNAPGTQNNPYTVAQARAAIDAGTGVNGVYVTGTVSKIVTAYNSTYGTISYDISTDGLTTSDQLRAYRGKSYNGVNFTSSDDIKVGDVVVVYGNLMLYNNSIYEFSENNQLVSLVRPKQDVTMSFNQSETFAAIGETFTAPTLTTTPSGLTVSYESSNTSVATVDSSTGAVSIAGVGTTTITASFAGNDSYNAGSASYSLTVSKGTVTMSFDPTSATATVGQDFTEPMLSTTPSGLTVTYSSGNTNIATVDASTGDVTPVAAGTTTITASFAGNDSYNGNTASYTLTISEASTPSSQALLYEGLSEYLETGDGNTALTTQSNSLDYDGWDTLTSIYPSGPGYENGGCLKFGTSKVAGSITSSGVSLTGSGTLTFYLKKYGSDTGKLNVSVTNATADVTQFTPSDTWTLCTVNLTGGNGNVIITLETSSKRAYVDEITLTSGSGGSQSANPYYQLADGKKGAALKTAMCGIIYNRVEQTYNGLWTAFNTTDARNGSKVWDMYSNITNYELGGSAQGASTTEEGVSYNREHSFPKSWFGGEVMPMYTDLHHVYPVDGYINQRRSNNPFGETDGETYKSANDFSKLGACTYTGYTGKVFEPADEYKGDFARTYFYMVTCYEEKLNDWYTNYGVNNTGSGQSETRNAVLATLDGSTYPGLTTWQLNMLMEWAKNDPVSEKETNRNNAVYAIQNNRNPFIDYPGLEEYIWGFMKDVSFSYDNYQQPVYNQDVTMSFGQTNVTATVGQDFVEPTLTTNPTNLTVTYSSSNEAVATVDASTGEVTPVAAGTTTIAATFAGNGSYNENSASYTLNVNGVNSVSLSETSKTIVYTDGAFNLTANVPAVNYNGTVTAESSNEYVAAVAVDGTTVTVIPVAVGTATITVTAGTDTYYPEAAQAECTVEFTAPEGETTAPSSGTSGSTLLFGESFGDNSGSARAWDDSYSEKTGVSDVYSGMTGYTVSNAKQSKNTMGSTRSGLTQTTQGTDAYIIVGPLNVANYSNLNLTYQWKAASTKGTYSTSTFYATSSNGTYTEVQGTGDGATSYVERTYTLPTAAQVSALYLKIVWNTSNTQGIIDEVQLKGESSAASTTTVTINKYGYATYCSALPIDYSSTDGYTAWRISSIADDGTITFEKITEQIKGGQGVLLYNKDADGVNTSTATITFADGDTEFSDAQNRFVGTTAPTYVASETAYGLSTNKFVKNNVAGVIPAGKAYIPAAEIPNNVRAFTFVFSDPITGISETQTVSPEEFGAMFNLAGQRISQPQKGVIIVNGKKILVR